MKKIHLGVEYIFMGCQATSPTPYIKLRVFVNFSSVNVEQKWNNMFQTCSTGAWVVFQPLLLHGLAPPPFNCSCACLSQKTACELEDACVVYCSKQNIWWQDGHFDQTIPSRALWGVDKIKLYNFLQTLASLCNIWACQRMQVASTG